jgi:hypothetical protein
MNDYAWWLLTCEVAELRDPRAALVLAERAVEGTHRTNPYYLDTLALAQCDTGGIGQAVATQQASLDLLPSSQTLIGPELKREFAKDFLDARGIPALAPMLRTWHQQRSGIGVDSLVRLDEFMGSVSDLYETWNRIEPDRGYDVKAAQWQAKRSGIH